MNCIIGSFQVFDQVYIMTKGGPLFKTQTLVQLIYSMAFDSFNMGYASTIAVALFIITFIISVFTFKHMTKGEEDLADGRNTHDADKITFTGKMPGRSL